MKHNGLFLNMAKWCFGVSFFEVLMLLWFLFGVSGIVPKVLKMLVFPVWGAFVGWVILVYLGLEGLGVLVFLCLFFIFVLVLFFVFALFLFCCWIVFGVGSCFDFVFFFVFWLFFGQVRWPKGPPHLALNPPYFICFVFFCFIIFCFFVFLGGFKGQVRWPRGSPHLALNPPYVFFVFLSLFSFLCFNRKTLFPP